MKAGYLGPAGTFTEQAAIKYYNGQSCLLEPMPTIRSVIEAVSNGRFDEGIVPFENSIEGTVTMTIDALIFDFNLFITGELALPIEQNLLVKESYSGGAINKIISHPQGLAQCDKFIRRLYPDAELVSASSTSEAAKMVSELPEADVASISPIGSAALYGLRPLHKSIQDDSSNATRFVCVTARRPEPAAHLDKTSIVFETEHTPGSLYKILDILSIWDLNMTKIESRPMKHTLGTYCFFVDLKSNNAKDLTDALRMVERKSKYYKYLGSYMEYTGGR